MRNSASSASASDKAGLTATAAGVAVARGAGADVAGRDAAGRETAGAGAGVGTAALDADSAFAGLVGIAFGAVGVMPTAGAGVTAGTASEVWK